METVKAWLTLHPKVAGGLVAAVFLTLVAPWLAKQGVNVDPADPNVKVFLTMLAAWATPGGGQ